MVRKPKDQAPGELAHYHADGVLNFTAVRLISFDEDSALWKCLHETGETIHVFPKNLVVMRRCYQNTNNFLCLLVFNGYEAAKLELRNAALAGNVLAMQSCADFLEGEDQAMWLRKAAGRGCETSMMRLADQLLEDLWSFIPQEYAGVQWAEMLPLGSEVAELLEKFLKSVRSGKRPWPIDKEREEAQVAKSKVLLRALLRWGILPDGIARANRLAYLMQGWEAIPGASQLASQLDSATSGALDLEFPGDENCLKMSQWRKAQMQAEQELERNANELLRSSKDACRELENERLKVHILSRLEHAVDVEELESAIKAASDLDAPELDTARARLANLQRPKHRLREAAKKNLPVQFPVSEDPLPLQLPTAEVQEEQPSSLSRSEKQKLRRNQIALKKREAAAETEAVKAADERKRLLRAHPSIWEPQSAAVEADGVVAEQILLVENDTLVRAIVLGSKEESSVAMPKSSASRRPVHRRAQDKLRLGLRDFHEVFAFTMPEDHSSSAEVDAMSVTSMASGLSAAASAPACSGKPHCFLPSARFARAPEGEFVTAAELSAGGKDCLVGLPAEENPIVRKTIRHGEAERDLVSIHIDGSTKPCIITADHRILSRGPDDARVPRLAKMITKGMSVFDGIHFREVLEVQLFTKKTTVIEVHFESDACALMWLLPKRRWQRAKSSSVAVLGNEADLADHGFVTQRTFLDQASQLYMRPARSRSVGHRADPSSSWSIGSVHHDDQHPDRCGVCVIHHRFMLDKCTQPCRLGAMCRDCHAPHAEVLGRMRKKPLYT